MRLAERCKLDQAEPLKVEQQALLPAEQGGQPMVGLRVQVEPAVEHPTLGRVEVQVQAEWAAVEVSRVRQ